MKKRWFVFMAAAVLVLWGAASGEEITVVGTGSGMDLLEAIGKKFTQIHPDVIIRVPESIGSSGGIKAVGTDQAKIGRIGRALKDTESHYGLTFVPFAKVPIVFFANKSVGITDITPVQACDIYSGKITEWQELGGKGPIRVIRREDGDSSLEVLVKAFPGFKDVTLTPKSKTTFTDQETLVLAEQKEGSIAFGTYSNARNAQVDVLSVNGKKPFDPDYPYYGILALIFKEANYAGNLKTFVEFVKSPDAATVIKESGGLPY